MNSIFNYWMNIAKEISGKTGNMNYKIWDWENHGDEIKKLKDKLGSEFITVLGQRINLNTGESEDLLIHAGNDPYNYAIYLFHYSKAIDTGMSGNWVKYYDLMDGLSKGVIPFKSYIDELKNLLDHNQSNTVEAIELIGGIKAEYGDFSYIINPLPDIQILFIYHSGDEEFSSELNILFDKNNINYLPPELIWAMTGEVVNRIKILIVN